jgi:putative glutamine amidotransferase
MKPIIGITSDVELTNKHVLNHNYIKAVIQTGGVPVILPIGIEEDVDQLAGMLDGLVVSGGGDIDPLLFGEEPHRHLGEISPGRDASEIALVQQFLALDKPILGICRGLQVLNGAVGGTMYQDIHSQHETTLLQHSQKARREHPSHFVHVEKGSLLESIAECDKFKVNSFHHQAVKNVPVPLMISGVASDGIIEAIESVQHHFVLGVQWHPEALAESGDRVARKIIDKFLDACKERRG